MQKILKTLISCALVYCSFAASVAQQKFPYQQFGLTEQQAATHLLNRFTFGIRPGEVDEVVKNGLEQWFDAQLSASLNEELLEKKLMKYKYLQVSNVEMANNYLSNGQIKRLAIKDGIIKVNDINNSKDYRDVVLKYMNDNNIYSETYVFKDFFDAQILRAIYANNQLNEILSDFWFNHFNVSFSKGASRSFIQSYMRDVIRPNALANFEDLLIASAKSPAMLTYLDNYKSMGDNEDFSESREAALRRRFAKQLRGGDSTAYLTQLKKVMKRNGGGLNENYARELMELHTLGVDGGYTQKDVTEAAKILTGWGLMPMKMAQRDKFFNNKTYLLKNGFVFDSSFLYSPSKHNSSQAKVLGENFSGKNGYEDGIRLLKMLAHHQATARFISSKLAVKFVSDAPPASLIEKMSQTFLSTNGNIRAVLKTMAFSQEFWQKEVLDAKIKSPFEYAISAIRGTNATVQRPTQVYNWINRMGQHLYHHADPNGYADNGKTWINSGSLLARMNYGISLASQKIPGVRINILALNHNKEPESAVSALHTYSKLLMPQKDLESNTERLLPMINAPQLAQKIAAKNPDVNIMDAEDSFDVVAEKTSSAKTGDTTIDNEQLAQILGVIIGSPQFQRK